MSFITKAAMHSLFQEDTRSSSVDACYSRKCSSSLVASKEVQRNRCISARRKN